MKKSRILQLIGYGLILCSLLAVLTGQIYGCIAQRDNQQVVSQIEQILPPRIPGVTDRYSVMDMPVLQVKGQDYVALLEVPAYGIRLPVKNTWKAGDLVGGPRRFFGTVYDGSLVIGGSDRSSQFDFLSYIQLGEAVMVTDMTGAQFTYSVSEIRRAHSVPAKMLMDGTEGLTMFVKESFSLEYIIVRCVPDAAAYTYRTE